MKNVITIDGPSSAGKGTVSKLLARKLGYKYLDTGALYRAVAWKIKKKKIDPDNEDALRKILKDINIIFNNERIVIDGADVTQEIRTSEIGELSSLVSAKPLVRQKLFSLQREICMQGNVVIEGRDIGSTIFPESENKFYLDASIEERARRRYEELKLKDPTIKMETTLADIKKRDSRDSLRENSPLKKTEDMFYIDTTDLSIDKVVTKIIDNLK